MGLMDKFKNLFTDEEIIEEEDIEPIEIKEVKKEEEVHKLPTFMREKIEKEEKEKEVKLEKSELPDLEIKRELKLESALEKPVMSFNDREEKNTFKFPMDLSDNDFVEKRSRQSLHHPKLEEEKTKQNITREVARKKEVPVRSEPKAKVADLYKDKKEEKKAPKNNKFRATPIISPIYGVLDKNYTPDDMENTAGKNFEEARHSKNVDFDSVRKKAYGSLSEEIKENLMCENCEYLKEAKECKEKRRKKEREYADKYSDKYSDDLSYNVVEEKKVTSRYDITLDEAAENYYDYGVAYEKVNSVYDDDAYNEVAHEEVKIVHHNEDVRPKKEIPPVKSSINLLSTLKKSMGDDMESSKGREENLELTDDLFNLIDSMYDERNETK